MSKGYALEGMHLSVCPLSIYPTVTDTNEALS